MMIRCIWKTRYLAKMVNKLLYTFICFIILSVSGCQNNQQILGDKLINSSFEEEWKFNYFNPYIGDSNSTYNNIILPNVTGKIDKYKLKNNPIWLYIDSKYYMLYLLNN